MLINKILVPVDGSEQSKNALNYAKEISEKFGAEITVMHVYEVPIPITGYEYSLEIYNTIEDNLTKYAQDVINESIKQIAAPELRIKELILTGDQGYQIIDTAEKNNFDLIIMGSRGLGAIKSFLVGSTSNFVLHHAKIPVLLIH